MVWFESLARVFAFDPSVMDASVRQLLGASRILYMMGSHLRIFADLGDGTRVFALLGTYATTIVALGVSRCRAFIRALHCIT